MVMSMSRIAHQRLCQQRLSTNPFPTPTEVVDWLGAVQAQEYPGAKWSLGMRTAGAVDNQIERAFNAGDILRTHIMRPTWHFVTPTDIRWIQDLTSAHVKTKMAYYDRRLEIDETLLRRCDEVIARAVEGGKQLNRGELAAALERAGISAEGQRLGNIVLHAELDNVICSGPRRGKQFTYILLAERAPQAKSLPREEALAELTRRYFTGHGPATAKDFAWWSGLSMAEVKAGLDMAAPHLANEEIEGQMVYSSAALAAGSWKSHSGEAHPAAEADPVAFLLPTYDEYHVGYANFGQAILFRREERSTPGFDSTILLGDRVIGTWRRTFQKGKVVVELAPLVEVSTSEKDAIEEAAVRYGKFLGMSIECVFIVKKG